MDPASNSGCSKSCKRTPTTIISITVNATLCKKHINSILAKKFSTFYGSQGFITTPIRSHHVPIPNHINVVIAALTRPISWRLILMSSSHLCLELPCGLLPSGFPTKTLYAPLLTSIRTKYPTHLNLTAFTTQIYGKHSRSQSSSFYNLLQSLLRRQLAQLSSSAP